MRRLSFLVALIALTSAILTLADGGDAEGKTRRHKLKPGAHPAGAATGRPAAKRPAKRAPVRTRAAVLADAPTSPDAIPRRLMIVGFDGKGAQVARGAAAAALRPIPSVRVVPLSPADAMRVGTAYGVEKTTGLAQRLNLTAVLYGTIKQAKREVSLSLTLANGEDGRVVGEIAFQARSLGVLRAKVKTQLWPKLQPLIDQAASPGRPESGEAPVAAAEPAGEVPEAPAERQTPPDRILKERKPPPPRPPAGEEAQAAAVPPIAEVPETSPKVPPVAGRKAAGSGEKEGEGTGATPIAAGEAGQEGDGNGEGEVPVERTERQPHRRPATGTDAEPEDEGIPGVQAHGDLDSERCSTAELSPGAGVMARRFNYRAEQRGALRGYSLFRAPVGRIEGTLYPFAGGRCRVSTGFGLRAAYERMGPVSSQLANRELGTQGSAYQVELVLRMVSGRLTLQPALGFLARQYRVDGDVVPTADYRAVGGGLDAELRGRYLAIALGASARWIMGAGTLGNADWFPNWTGYAASGHAQVSVAAADWMDLVLGGAAEYELFNFAIDRNAPSPNGVAGGAYDLYLQGTLSVRFRLGRGGRKGGGDRSDIAATAGGVRASSRRPPGGGAAVSSR